MDLQEGDVDVCHRIVVTLGRVANEKFTLRIIVVDFKFVIIYYLIS